MACRGRYKQGVGYRVTGQGLNEERARYLGGGLLVRTGGKRVGASRKESEDPFNMILLVQVWS